MNTNILRKASPKLSIGLTAKKSRFGWVLALTLALWAAVGQAQELRYHYVALNEVPLPAGFVFFSSEAINASGSVYGEVFDEESFAPHVAVYQNGT